MFIGILAKKTSGSWAFPPTYDNKSFSVATEEASLQGFYMREDGAKFYIFGNTGKVFQYTITGGDISTAVYDSKTYTSAEYTANGRGIYFKPDGTKMYLSARGWGPSSSKTYQYRLSTAWDVSTASYDSKFILWSLATLNGGTMLDDGTEIICVRETDARTDRRVMGTPWDISTATTNTSVVYDSLIGNSKQVYYSKDADKFYSIDSDISKVVEFTLAGANDIANPTKTADYDFTSEYATMESMYINESLSKLYLGSDGSNTIYQYSL